ncbi:MAG TPA: hypothetical protein ENO30_06440 [Thermodesulfobium narugense]|nr:MAG: hypothetical protein C0174_04535 [Thermodesulfobium narugense]HEM56378.1 hypothetical protein [Thermodesulfobium narugense]
MSFSIFLFAFLSVSNLPILSTNAGANVVNLSQEIIQIWEKKANDLSYKYFYTFSRGNLPKLKSLSEEDSLRAMYILGHAQDVPKELFSAYVNAEQRLKEDSMPIDDPIFSKALEDKVDRKLLHYLDIRDALEKVTYFPDLYNVKERSIYGLDFLPLRVRMIKLSYSQIEKMNKGVDQEQKYYLLTLLDQDPPPDFDSYKVFINDFFKKLSKVYLM